MEEENPEVTSEISISAIVDSTDDASHLNEIKKEFPYSEFNLQGTAYTGMNIKLEMDKEVKLEITNEVWVPAFVDPKSETYYSTEIKKEFPLSEPFSHGEILERVVVKHEDSNMQLLDLQIKSEVPDTKYGIKSANDDIYIECEPLVSEQPHINNETHTREIPLKCSLCDYSSTVKSNLRTHMKSHTIEKLFKCNVCDYTCLKKGNLQRHEKIHTGEKPFKCNVCDYTCIQKGALKRHIKTHTGEKPFKCDACDYTCIDKSTLQPHMKTHTGEKPLKCNVCNYRCIWKSNLQNHLKTHTDEKPFECSLCDYRCIQKGDLRKHTITHTGEKPFKCDLCGYRCIEKSKLQRHMKTHIGRIPLK